MSEELLPCRQCGWPFDVGVDGLCKGCRELLHNPDGLSKRKTIGRTPFDDMKQLDEGDRIKQIVKYLTENPGRDIAVMVDVGEGYADKGDRYIRQVRTILPAVKLIKRFPGPIPGVESIIFRL